jgi:hypothetical protein
MVNKLKVVEVHFDVAEAAIGQDRHRHPLGQDRKRVRQRSSESLRWSFSSSLSTVSHRSGVARPWRVMRFKASVA